MALFLSLGVNAQTLSTDTFSDANGNMPAVGDTFNVPINVASIGEIYTLTAYLDYDTNALIYVGYANAAYAMTVSTEGPTNIVKVEAGSFPNTTTFADGLLVDIQFMYKGGYSVLNYGTSDSPVGPGYKSSILDLNFNQPYFTDADVTNGAVEGFFENTISGGDWTTAGDWSLGVVPNMHHNVTVMPGSETQANAAAHVHNITIAPGGQLTLTSTLTVDGNLLIQSDATGDGSFIYNGGTVNVTGSTMVERYSSAAQWHGISSPVAGATFASTYFGGTPEVWVKEFDEATGSFTYLTDVSQVMGDMTGYYSWIETAGGAQTFTFDGTLRTGTVGAPNNMVHANQGHNFVGNPFPSAINWDASAGWTKTNLYNAIYVYNGTSYASYVGGAGTNGGTEHIAMGQGFFVQVNGAGPGTLTMDQRVCEHNAVGFMKNQQAAEQKIVRLQLNDSDKTDETVIRFADDATPEFDGNLDAHKFFSFDPEYPQIYSTANDFMSINSLPFNANTSVTIDVKGKDGNTMTISATEADGFEFLNLVDNYTGKTTDLKNSDYTFTYNSSISNRFELFFGFLGVDETPVTNYAKIFAANQNIQVVLKDANRADISVYNLLGQVITSRSTSSTFTSIPLNKTGYYIVKVNDGQHITTQKVFIK